MTSTTKSRALLSPDVLRAVYRRGRDLSPGERVVFEVLMVNGEAVRLSVGNASEGLVEVACADKLVCAQLRKLVGISVFLDDLATQGPLPREVKQSSGRLGLRGTSGSDPGRSRLRR